MEAMCVNNLPKVATQWNSGATRDSNRGRRVLIPSALTTRPPSHKSRKYTNTINMTVGACKVRVDIIANYVILILIITAID